MIRLPLIFAGIAFVAGCATTPEPNEAVISHRVDQAEEIKSERVSRGLTLSWENTGLGGAAIRQPAYVHVLGEGNLHESVHAASFTQVSNEGAEPATVVFALNEIDTASKDKREGIEGQAYSLYEMQRWERFCDNGKNMDEADWLFVTKQGGMEQLPSILLASCKAPAHNYKSYLAAWVGFCTGASITSHQRDIVRHSVRPKSEVNPCAALN